MKRLVFLIVLLCLVFSACDASSNNLPQETNTVNTSKITAEPSLQSSPLFVVPEHVEKLGTTLDNLYPELSANWGTVVGCMVADEYEISISFGGFDIGDATNDFDYVFRSTAYYVTDVLETFDILFPQYTVSSIDFVLLSGKVSVGFTIYDREDNSLLVSIGNTTETYKVEEAK